MKFSEYTIKIMQNFSTINNGIVIRKTKDGEKSIISTIDRTNSIYGRASVSEVFPNDFALYDMKSFLSVLSSFDNPEVEFSDTYLTVSDARSKTKILYADSIVITHPSKDVPKKEGAFSFTLTAQDQNKIMNMGSILNLSNIKVFPENGKLFLQIEDRTNPDTNDFRICVDESYSGKDFEPVYFKRESFKMIPADYTISVIPGSAALFQHTVDENLYYYVTLDRTAYQKGV